MKQPASKLPFEVSKNYSFMGSKHIFSESGTIAQVFFRGLGAASKNAEYIVEACNNYPKTTELLELALERLEINNIEKSEQEFINEIKQFLYERTNTDFP